VVVRHRVRAIGDGVVPAAHRAEDGPNFRRALAAVYPDRERGRDAPWVLLVRDRFPVGFDEVGRSNLCRIETLVQSTRFGVKRKKVGDYSRCHCGPITSDLSRSNRTSALSASLRFQTAASKK